MAVAQPKYKVFGPDAEVIGQAMLAFVESINFPDFKQVLAKHGLTQIDPTKWYPQQIWLDVFNELEHNTNASQNLISIGMKILDNSQQPPGIEQLPFAAIVQMSGQVYQINNRGKDIGYISTTIVGDNCIIVHDATPYPDDFVYGMNYALARKFLPRGTEFTVKYDPSAPRRDEGGKETLINISWQNNIGIPRKG